MIRFFNNLTILLICLLFSSTVYGQEPKAAAPKADKSSKAAVPEQPAPKAKAPTSGPEELPFDPAEDPELERIRKKIEAAEERLEEQQRELADRFRKEQGEPGTTFSNDRKGKVWTGKPLITRTTRGQKATLDWLYDRRARLVEGLIENPNDKTRQDSLDELDERIESLEKDLEQISSFRVAGPRTTSFLRVEYVENRDLNHRINDNDVRVPTRLDLGLSAVFAGVAKAFVLGTFSDTFDAKSRFQDFGESPDIYEAYIDLLLLRNAKYELTPRLGRQVFNFGSGRILGQNRFLVFHRSFDAVSLRYANKDFNITGFLGRPVERAAINDDELNQADFHENLFGLYWHIFPEQSVQFDLFALRKQSTRRIRGEDSNDEDTSTIFTFGMAVRLLHKSGFGGEFEFMAQTGTNAGDFHESYAASGLVFKEWYWDPAPSDEDLPPDVVLAAKKVPYLRLFTGFDWADGDRNSTDGRSQGFQPVYPSVHKFFGLADILGQRNILDLYGGFSLLWRSEPSAKGFSTVELTVTGHYFRQDERDDFNINIASQPLFAPGNPIGSGHIGQELDVELRLFDLVTIGYARFIPGQALRRRGLRDPTNYFYVNIGF